MRNFEGHMQIADRCATWKLLSGAENLTFPGDPRLKNIHLKDNTNLNLSC